MKYIEVSISHKHPHKNEILIASLADVGFESFMENEDGLMAYIQEPMFNEVELKSVLLPFAEDELKVTVNSIADQNWNAVWESNFQPVMVGDICFIRAPFHPANPEAKYDIIIEPKMSFGTAHHETTSTMIELLLLEDLKEKSLLDMGCGTGVLAIFAEMLGAKPIVAIDNDSWAYENTIENIERNHCSHVTAYQGDAASIENHHYDIVLANINRNILLADMHTYAKTLNPNGLLFMSGFYEEDFKQIEQKANDLGMKNTRKLTKNNWIACVFKLQ
ncbi:MAG: 50S ribosomal protein L11 methyltransferase [Bacteroidota bacterium]